MVFHRLVDYGLVTNPPGSQFDWNDIRFPGHLNISSIYTLAMIFQSKSQIDNRTTWELYCTLMADAPTSDASGTLHENAEGNLVRRGFYLETFQSG